MLAIETVRSKDGTSIAYERRGHGPPLVMVHGSTVDHIPREVAVASTYRFRAEGFAGVRVPTLFIVGSLSPAYMHEATTMASAALAGSQVESLRGQGHAAMSTGPRIFLEKVLPFLGATQ